MLGCFVLEVLNMRSLFLFVLFIHAAVHAATDSTDLERKIGQLIMVGFRGCEIENSDWIAQQIAAGQIGGVNLYAYDSESKTYVRNIKSPQQLRQLCSSLQKRAAIPVLIAIDQEGGLISHLKPEFGFPESVSAELLGKKDNLEETYKQGFEIGKMLADTGINLNFSPVVDVNINPQSPCIGKKGRSFSSDPDTVANHALEIIKGHHKNGVLTAIKHFPGHGSASTDSHEGFTDISATWSEKELIPYKKLIPTGQVDVIMTAHVFNCNLDPSAPATLSKKVIRDLLRENMQYDGVIISDDLQMGAIRNQYSLENTIKLALQAGVDILLFSNQQVYDPNIATKAIAIITNFISSGVISEERINQSFCRVSKLKAKLIPKEG